MPGLDILWINLMRIHVLSDLHLEFGPIDLPKVEADLVVLAGDIHVKLNGIRWIRDNLPETPVIYVAGSFVSEAETSRYTSDAP